ncbi:hypothetical protein HD597_010093 [Nonomuraea thailandensis]|uniref:Uncharacterized protein n=1 Tax=Nonomuraea thailandensis TaxID=1188745 RepID=A0A9X2GZ52_9ACTN|nr:hypothetical protein [Nonomuraea thailandensis]MCP2363073.1 hypothetical protein [Nonomuraea thailandensis]
MTRFEYDDETGRLVRAITEREPEWLEEDLNAAQAAYEEERNRCPGACGLPLDTTVGEANDGAFVAPPPYRCHACEVIIARQKEWDGLEVRDLVFHARRRD